MSVERFCEIRAGLGLAGWLRSQGATLCAWSYLQPGPWPCAAVGIFLRQPGLVAGATSDEPRRFGSPAAPLPRQRRLPREGRRDGVGPDVAGYQRVAIGRSGLIHAVQSSARCLDLDY